MYHNILPDVLIMLFCIVMSAYFSATETAFSSLNRTRMRVLAENGDKRARLACNLSEDYDKLISTILIGNNIVNIVVASVGTLLFVKLYGDIGATISTVVVTVVVLIFGEITPKSVAKDYPERFAMFSAPLIRVLIYVLTPLNYLFSQWKKLVNRLFRVKKDTGMSQEELLALLDDVRQEGSIDADEGELLRNAVEFGDLTAEDILTHRVDLEAVSVDAPQAEVAQAFTASHFSRILVYEDTIDRIVGVVHQKDFYVGVGVTDRPIRQIMTRPVFVLPSEKVNDLLKVLQASKSHLAVVIDEYGGTLGIVTMEDILEELVGEIWDEHDTVEESFQTLADDACLVDADVNFEDFCAHFSLRAEAQSVSLGGWIMEQLGRIPKQGDSFCFGGLTLTVEQTNGNRIRKVRVETAEAQ